MDRNRLERFLKDVMHVCSDVQKPLERIEAYEEMERCISIVHEAERLLAIHTTPKT